MAAVTDMVDVRENLEVLPQTALEKCGNELLIENSEIEFRGLSKVFTSSHRLGNQNEDMLHSKVILQDEKGGCGEGLRTHSHTVL